MLVVFGLIALFGIALLVPTFHLLRLGELVMVEEPQSGSPDALVAVAERCGTIERSTLSYLESQRLMRGATLNL
ncbi:hypothetical protein [Pseudactinotalea sp.]|uniref:hypothetical protein n=1 Tax=Pseudactinotalea sp. TaxID=1926260 RepID=UPI003B3A5A27